MGRTVHCCIHRWQGGPPSASLPVGGDHHSPSGSRTEQISTALFYSKQENANSWQRVNVQILCFNLCCWTLQSSLRARTWAHHVSRMQEFASRLGMEPSVESLTHSWGIFRYSGRVYHKNVYFRAWEWPYLWSQETLQKTRRMINLWHLSRELAAQGKGPNCGPPTPALLS